MIVITAIGESDLLRKCIYVKKNYRCKGVNSCATANQMQCLLIEKIVHMNSVR